jgi:hypothetical protein
VLLSTAWLGQGARCSNYDLIRRAPLTIPPAVLDGIGLNLDAATVCADHPIRAVNVLIGAYEFEREPGPTS